MKAYWCRGCGPGNFGDWLTPAILGAFGIPVTWAPIRGAQLVMVGSVLSKLPVGWPGMVLGTGLIKRGMHPHVDQARVLAIRGSLTRDAAHLSKRTPLGDPGILVPRLPRNEYPPAGTVLVPHYVDQAMVKRHPGLQVIDIRRPAAEVAGKIAAAERVITSSLHALIAADSLGVPHVWEPHAAVIGGSFKFLDYGSAFGVRVDPGRVRLTPRSAMAERQEEIAGLIRSITQASPAMSHA